MTTRTYSGENPMDNPLCQRLQREFRGRGIQGAQFGARAETSVMLERVKRGLDPYENAADPAKRTVSELPRVSRTRPQAASRPAARHGERQTNCVHTSAAAPRTVRPPVKEQSARPTAKAAAAQTVRRAAPAAAARSVTAAESGTQSGIRVSLRAMAQQHRAEVLYRNQVLHNEVKVHTPFPVAAVFMLCIFTIMALVLLLSFSQNYELQGEISQLYDEAYRLEQLQRDLKVQLEERDDIRVIEDIAVNEIGMVKNDLVESRFVSVSGGDRIELTDTAEEEAVQAGLWSTMLSAIGENFSRIREYIE